MKNLIKKLIEWAFFKYVIGDVLVDDGEEELEIVFDSDLDLKLETLDYSLGGSWDLFEEDIERAMLERRFHTLH